MPFSRRTIMRAVDVLATSNPNLNALELEFDLEARGYTVQDRANALARLLIGDPGRMCAGENVTDAVVHRAVEHLVAEARRLRGLFLGEGEVWGNPLWNALKKDGFTLDDNEQLQPMMPGPIDVPATDDEVHALLDQ